MTESPYQRIFEQIRTVEDVRLTANSIDLLLVSLYKTHNGMFQETLSASVERGLAESILLTLQEQNIGLSDYARLETFFSALKQQLAAIHTLHLTLAYHPTNEQVEQLSDWVRQATRSFVVLEIRVNPDQIAGAVITYKGKYVDLSLKKKLSAVYQTKREEILSMLT